MLKERIDDLVDILGEEYARIENTFVIRSNEQLAKYLDNPKAWKAKQLASRAGLKREFISAAKEQLRVLNEKAEKVFLLSYKEVDKDVIEITESEIVAKNIPSDVKEQIKRLKEFNANQVLKLANQSLSTYTKSVRIIDALSTPDNLYETIKKQMPKGIENGVKVVYEDGKQFTWKSYMEMNVRTTIHQEMTQRQMEVGARVGQIFYICDSFADCAPDHADYQGKIYYNADADISEEAQKYIDENQIQSMQEVTNGHPFLTSRPNCRHNFHAIPTSSVLTQKADKILEDEGLKFGNYKGSNYEALQKQRYNERQIRKWKLKKENAEKIQRETGIKNVEGIKAAQHKVSEWQKRQRELIDKHDDVLKRQYDRENARVMVDHLGVKYDYRVKNGELEKK